MIVLLQHIIDNVMDFVRANTDAPAKVRHRVVCAGVSGMALALESVTTNRTE